MIVSSGSESRRYSTLRMMVKKCPVAFLVLPTPPGNSVSPLNSALPTVKQVLPGVCPGVWIAFSTFLPNGNSWRSIRS
jgi:hypothetical protein